MLKDLMFEADSQLFETENAILELIRERNAKKRIMYDDAIMRKIVIARRFLTEKKREES